MHVFNQGISTQFHPQNASWLMVAQRNGEIQIMDIETKEWVISLEIGLLFTLFDRYEYTIIE